MKVHGEAWKPASPAGMREPAFVEPSCEALTKRQLPPQLSSHRCGAPERTRIGVLSISCTREKARYPPKPATARQTDTCEMRATTFCSTANSTRAGMGDARLQGSRRALIPWLPEATTQSYCEFAFIHKKLESTAGNKNQRLSPKN